MPIQRLAAACAACSIALFFSSREARARGRLVGCVETAAPAGMLQGVRPSYAGVQVATHRCRLEGATAVPHDLVSEEFGYDLNVWIVGPVEPSRRNGRVVLEMLHTVVLEQGVARSSGSSGEMPLGLMYLQPDFLFARGYSWATLRWDPVAYQPQPSGAAHLFDPATPVSGGFAQPDAALVQFADVGIAAVADFADALRIGWSGEGDSGFRGFEKVLAFGHSQQAAVLSCLIFDTPAARSRSIDGRQTARHRRTTPG